MSKKVLKKSNLLAYTVAGGFSAILACVIMSLLGLSGSTEDPIPIIAQGLLYGCLFIVFNIFTLRLSNWLYS